MKRHEMKMLLAKFPDRANCWQCNSEIVNTLQTLEQEIAKRYIKYNIFKKYISNAPFHETMMKKEESADVSIDIFIFHHGSSRSYWEAK